MDLGREQQLEVEHLVGIFKCTFAAASEAIGLTPTFEDAVDCFDPDKGLACLEHWRAKYKAAISAGHRQVTLRSDGAGASTDALATTQSPASASLPQTEPDGDETPPSVPPPGPPPQLDEEEEMNEAFNKLYENDPAAALRWIARVLSEIASAQLKQMQPLQGKRKRKFSREW